MEPPSFAAAFKSSPFSKGDFFPSASSVFIRLSFSMLLLTVVLTSTSANETPNSSKNFLASFNLFNIYTRLLLVSNNVEANSNSLCLSIIEDLPCCFSLCTLSWLSLLSLLPLLKSPNNTSSVMGNSSSSCC